MSNQVISVAAKLKRIREAYIKQLPVQLEVIGKAFSACTLKPTGAEELEILHRALHTLKGKSAPAPFSRRQPEKGACQCRTFLCNNAGAYTGGKGNNCR
jgi:hypothetical protein